MTFEEYKSKYNLGNSQLARLLKTSPSCIHHWIIGYSKPNSKNAINIYRITKGEITLEDMGIV
jgi:DNA-binding transcriptional regulator YdaS (Cro superfamily)